MRGNIWKLLFAFSVLLVFAFAGELTAQTIHFGTHPDTIYYNAEIQLAAALDTGGGVQTGDTVLFSVISGDGSVSPAFDTTDAWGVTVTDFTAGTTGETVFVEAKWVNPANTDSLVDTTYIEVVPAPETLTLTPPERAIVPNERLLLNATLLDEEGDPVEDTVVTFSVVAGSGSVSPEDIATDASGVVIDTLTAGSGAGPRTISVEVAWTDGTITLADTVDVEVAEGVPTELTITPVTTSVDVIHDEVTLTVTLTDGTDPVEGLIIDFTVLNDLGAVAPTSDVTDDDGKASTTYDAGTVVGVDTVVATWTDEILRATLTARTIITIGPGSVTKVSLTPVDTTFVVTDGVTYTAE